ncbi:MFS transporter [Paramicrobacterium fandaimingii]|uniref:MFS transporter n=1 Tax=Paramicrobacterium fandaimingii TaxID=2708079 RepID=UPI00141E818B|nr:MFS transporter [Microbacterium fandaimingii]
MGVFGPFRERSFALFFAGQVTSNVGLWFQNLALQLVVLGTTGSAQALSGVTIAQFLPIIVLAVPAGRLADRIRPRSILLATSVLAACVAACIGLVVTGDDPDLMHIYALVAAFGTVQAFERVASQTLIFELVGPQRLSKAVSISTVAIASARSVGPGLAGLAFHSFGASTCMLLNAAGYLFAGLMLFAIRQRSLHARAPAASGPKLTLRRFVRDRSIATLLIVNVVIALFALNFGLVLTSTVDLSFGGDATSVGFVHALNAVGAIGGGILAASRPAIGVRSLIVALSVFGVALMVNAAAPTLGVFLLVSPLLGFGIGCYQGVLNAAAQSSAPPEAIGRLMSLVTIGNYGMTPFGALFMGWVIDASSGRVSLLIGGIVAVACAAFVAIRAPRT